MIEMIEQGISLAETEILDMLDEGFSSAEIAAILGKRNDSLKANVRALNARIAKLEREQNSPDYRTLIRFPTAE